jgi:hypothetical protein
MNQAMSGGKESAVTKLTRRSFLKQTSASAAALSLLPAVPALAVFSHSAKAPVTDFSATVTHPMVAHVTDAALGEITLLVEDQEIIFRDPQTVARLIKAARRVQRTK